MRVSGILLGLLGVTSGDDTEINMTPGGMPSPPVKRVVNDERFNKLVPEGDWEMILNVMVWTEGPTWWNDKLTFSDTRLGKIFSWDPVTKLTDVVLERSGCDFIDTGVWMELGSNGLAYNSITDELVICQHGNRAIATLSKTGKVTKIAQKSEFGPFNSPNDVAVHQKTGDIYFTDPVFGKQTINENLIRGNMGEAPELDSPGFSGVYRIDAKTGGISLIEKSMEQPNGIGITPENELIVAHCNETIWEWWKWPLNEDGTAGEKEIFIDGTDVMSGPGYPDGLDIDEAGNVWVSAPGGFYIYDKNGKYLGAEKFLTIAISNVLLAPDNYIYLTGNHGVYRKNRNAPRDEL